MDKYNENFKDFNLLQNGEKIWTEEEEKEIEKYKQKGFFPVCVLDTQCLPREFINKYRQFLKN